MALWVNHLPCKLEGRIQVPRTYGKARQLWQLPVVLALRRQGQWILAQVDYLEEVELTSTWFTEIPCFNQ